MHVRCTWVAISGGDLWDFLGALGWAGLGWVGRRVVIGWLTPTTIRAVMTIRVIITLNPILPLSFLNLNSLIHLQYCDKGTLMIAFPSGTLPPITAPAALLHPFQNRYAEEKKPIWWEMIFYDISSNCLNQLHRLICLSTLVKWSLKRVWCHVKIRGILGSQKRTPQKFTLVLSDKGLDLILID